MNGIEMINNVKKQKGRTVNISYSNKYNLESVEGILMGIRYASGSHPGLEKDTPIIVLSLPNGEQAERSVLRFPIISEKILVSKISDLETGEVLLANTVVKPGSIVFGGWKRIELLKAFFRTEVDLGTMRLSEKKASDEEALESPKVK